MTGDNSNVNLDASGSWLWLQHVTLADALCIDYNKLFQRDKSFCIGHAATKTRMSCTKSDSKLVFSTGVKESHWRWIIYNHEFGAVNREFILCVDPATCKGQKLFASYEKTQGLIIVKDEALACKFFVNSFRRTGDSKVHFRLQLYEAPGPGQYITLGKQGVDKTYWHTMVQFEQSVESQFTLYGFEEEVTSFEKIETTGVRETRIGAGAGAYKADVECSLVKSGRIVQIEEWLKNINEQLSAHTGCCLQGDFSLKLSDILAKLNGAFDLIVKLREEFDGKEEVDLGPINAQLGLILSSLNDNHGSLSASFSEFSQ